MRRRPPALCAGDQVALVAPAGPVPAGLVTAGVSALMRWGCAIVLLEDVGEEPYRIDQFLTHLLRRWFDRAAGIVLGSWYRCGDSERLHDVLVDRLDPLGLPMVAEFGFGHCPVQLTMSLGATVELDADARTLTPL